MIVYCITLPLKKGSTLEPVLTVISRWLSQKSQEAISADSLSSTGQRSLRQGHIQVISTETTFPFLTSIRYHHPDRFVSGRQWVTEIGLRQQKPESEIEFSLLLRTDEISTQVEARIQPTVPFVVHEILKHCSPAAGTAGLTIITLDNDSEVDAFGYAIEYTERDHPYVLVSASPNGKYLVDIEKLRFLLEGIADVIRIPIDADTFLIEQMLGKQYAAWRGAINLIFPEIEVFGKRFAPTKRLLPDEIANITEEGGNLETQILSLVTHRTNPHHSRRHLSPETVLDVIRRRELARSQKVAAETGESADYIKLLEDDTRETDRKNRYLQEKVEQLQDEVHALNGALTQADDEQRQLRFENEGLILSLSYAGGSDHAGKDVISEPVRSVLFNIASEHFTLRESLQVITELYPDRVEVLESAWRSADDSESFKDRKKAFDLMWKSVTVYWDQLISGRGDAEARNVFGNAYSAKESATVEGNKRARRLRTFQYKGQDLEMMKHLKIGVKDSVAETLRIHFEWDATEQKIIIGHCGRHLPHK